MKPRVMVLPFAAIVILGLVLLRLSRDESPSSASSDQALPPRLAPRFELYDQQSNLVKFERYLGRERVVLVFMDDPLVEQATLEALRAAYDAIRSLDAEVVVVTTARPAAIRQAAEQGGGRYPFPILADFERESPRPAPVHRMWNRRHEFTGRSLGGLFLVDRSGLVAWSETGPVPVEDTQAAIAALSQGVWPSAGKTSNR